MVSRITALFSSTAPVDVGVGEPRPDQREPADLIGGVPGLLDYPGGQRVVRHR